MVEKTVGCIVALGGLNPALDMGPEIRSNLDSSAAWVSAKTIWQFEKCAKHIKQASQHVLMSFPIKSLNYYISK
jgi:hypothetical protein